MKTNTTNFSTSIITSSTHCAWEFSNGVHRTIFSRCVRNVPFPPKGKRLSARIRRIRDREGLRGEKDKQGGAGRDGEKRRGRRTSRKGNRSAQVRTCARLFVPSPTRFACFTTSLSSALLNFALAGNDPIYE